MPVWQSSSVEHHNVKRLLIHDLLYQIQWQPFLGESEFEVEQLPKAVTAADASSTSLPTFALADHCSTA